MTGLEALAAELRAGGVADPTFTLTAAERVRLVETLARHSERELSAYVVVAEPGRPLAELHPLWSMLGLREERDLLLLYNGARWEAKGWGLTAAKIGATLDAAEPELKREPARGLERALDALAALVPGAGFPWGLATAGGLALGAVGWVIARRLKLQRARRVRIAAALSSAEAVQADVMIAAEELPRDVAAEVQLRAASLGEVLQRAAEVENEAVAVGRVTQIESELNALHSEVLARARRGPS